METMEASNPFAFIFEQFTPNEFCTVFAKEEPQTRAFILSFSQSESYQREVMDIYDDTEFTEVATAYLQNEEREKNYSIFASEISDYLESVLQKEGITPYLKYTGDIVNGLRHGHGKAEWENGNVYEGDFVEGKRVGKGKLTFADGGIYEGDFVDGKCSGKGKDIYANGNTYEGDFIEGKRVGKGKYVFKSGNIYEGDFFDDYPHGKGKYTFTSGEIYEGDFVNGKYHGTGKLTFKNGHVYEGDFINDKRTGKGKYVFANGNIYEGDFVDGKRTGKGKYTYLNGEVYEGDFIDGWLVQEATNSIFKFDDIVLLDDSSILRFMRELDSQELAKALKAVGSEVQNKIFHNMTKRAAVMLKEDMEYMGPVRLKDVETAQEKIVAIIGHLEDQNEIVIPYISENNIFFKPINERALKYIPKEDRTAELCLKAVKSNCFALQYVPEEHKTAELCLEAVKSSGYTLKYVPEKHKTAELCFEAIKAEDAALDYIPEEQKTTELCLQAVKKITWALLDIPEKHKTAELCLEAVKSSGRALQYIPEEQKTAKLCLQAVKSDSSAFEYVPEEHRTAELCLQAASGQNLSDTAKSYYNAMGFIAQQKYHQAYLSFKNVVDSNTDTYLDFKYVSKSNFEIGRCLFLLNKFDDCIQYYAMILTKYPKHSNLADALFYMGQSHEKVNRKDQAQTYYKKILSLAGKEEDGIKAKTWRALKVLEETVTDKDGALTAEEIAALLAGVGAVPLGTKSVQGINQGQHIKAFEEQNTNWPETIPQEGSLSLRGFVNCYYKLVETVLYNSNKARRQGLLALNEGLAASEDFFKAGLLLVTDRTDAEIIRHILTTAMEREHDFYKKRLMGIAIEGILGIQRGDPPSRIVFHLNSMVDIKDNPIDAAWEKFLSGDNEAFLKIDFKSAIQPEKEREEVRFIKKAIAICEIAYKEGLVDIESHLDKDAIAACDVFEYGLSLFVDGVSAYIWMEDGPKYIAGVLAKMVERETDPVQKNLALAKKEAVLSISAKDKPKILARKILAYFDRSIANAIK